MRALALATAAFVALATPLVAQSTTTPATPPVHPATAPGSTMPAGHAGHAMPATAAMPAATMADEHADHADHADQHATHMAQMAAGTGAARADSTLPPSGDEAEARLAASPRHGEWVTVRTGTGDSTRAWVVYPERRDKAPVVIVVHEIFGLSPWIRSVADQLAAEGYIAVAPDLLTRFNVAGSPNNPNADSARAAIRNVDMADMNRQVTAVAAWAMKLPSALPMYGIVGFCWGGSSSFSHAVFAPAGLKAAVVYYGTSPEAPEFTARTVPVLGNYGADDARVVSTIPRADSAMAALKKPFEHHEYAGAGHGFLRQQDGREGANMAATRAAWPATLAWFKQYLIP